MLEDKQKQQAIFVTQSNVELNQTFNYLIDSVTVLKLVVAADGKLANKQLTIALPSKQVNAKVICTFSNDIIHCYCFF